MWLTVLRAKLAALFAILSLVMGGSSSGSVPLDVSATPISTPSLIVSPSPLFIPSPAPTPTTTPLPYVIYVVATPVPNNSGQTEALNTIKQKMSEAKSKYTDASNNFKETSAKYNICRKDNPEINFGLNRTWENDQWIYKDIPDPCLSLKQPMDDAAFDSLWYGQEYDRLEKQYLDILGQK